MIHSFTFEEKYSAIMNRDASFEGVFITAVKTTGIFCRPVCTARKPKPENVIFYDTAHEAILNGFRPCQVCKPLAQASETPGFIQQLISELSADPYLRIKDADLRNRGIAPSQLRRWFKRNHNMSFHVYQRMLRINSAFQKIATGEPVTATAFDSGYNSLSGFNDGYRSIVGSAPTQSKGKAVIHITRFPTPLGPMFACATTSGVCLLEFTNRKMLETEFRDLCERLNAVILPGANNHLVQVETEIKEYFDGKRTLFTVALHTPGTEFQRAVWKALREIPFGGVTSYKQQAIQMDKIKSIRAIASANGCNRISIIIPCHRVVGENGKLTGYGGGLPRKKWLLDFEKEVLNKSSS